MRTYLLYAAGWLGMVVLAIVNGIVRERVYGERMSQLAAHQVSTLIGIILIGAYAWFFTGAVPPVSSDQALLVGIMWLALTVAFEFLFGHYVMKHPWRRLLADYNLLKGRLWLLFLLWTAGAPFLLYLVRA